MQLLTSMLAYWQSVILTVMVHYQRADIDAKCRVDRVAVLCVLTKCQKNHFRQVEIFICIDVYFKTFVAATAAQCALQCSKAKFTSV